MVLAGLAVILFSDLVASTELLARLGDDEMDRVRREHVANVRAVVSAHDGVVVKTLGDGVMARFDSAMAALRAGWSLQLTVDRQDAAAGGIGLAARVGIAAGEPVADGGDLHGMAVVIASRLCAAAPSGRVLVHDLVEALVASRDGVGFAAAERLEIKGVPDPVGAAVLERIDGADTLPPSPAVPSPVPLLDGVLEREREIDALERRLSAARDRRGGCVLLAGEAGIGKTTLLDGAARTATAAGMTVCRARGARLEASFGHGVLRQLLEAPLRRMPPADRQTLLSGAAALAAPALGLAAAGEASTDGEFATRHGLYWLTAGLAEHDPLVLVVDDAQWADLPSLHALLYLARRVEDLPVALALAWRTGEPGEQDEVLDLLRMEPGVVELLPRPLTGSAVAAVVRAGRGEASKAFTSACAQASGGNPFLLSELLRDLRADATVPQVSRLGPESVARRVRGLLANCSSDARALARAVAILDSDAELRHAAAVAGVDPAAAALAADELVAVGLLDAGRPLRYRHPILRSAVDALLAGGERSVLHGRAAETLASEDASLDRAAVQLLATEPTGDPWVVGILLASARRAAGAGAPAAAVELLERALREGVDDQEFDVLLQLGVAEAFVQLPEAIARLERATERAPDDERRFRAAFELGRALWWSGRTDEAVAVLDGVAGKLAGEDAGRALAVEAEATTAGVYDDRVAHSMAERLARSARALTPDSPDARAVIANHAYLRATVTDGPASEVAALIAPISEPDVLRDGFEGSFLFAALGWTSVAVGRHEQSRRLVDRALTQARDAGHVATASTAYALVSHLATVTGDLAEAQDTGRLALDMAQGRRFSTVPLAVGVLVAALRGRGALDDADRVLAEQGLLDAAPQMLTSTPLLAARLPLHLSRGRAAEAAADAYELLARAEIRGGWWPGIGAPVAYGLRAGGDETLAREVLDAEIARARAWDEPGTTGIVLCAAAGFVERDEALELLRRGVGLLEGSGRVLSLAGGLVRLGAALRRAGRRVDAREPLARGLELAHRCGAEPLVAIAHEELLACGARPRKLVRTGVDALTVSELRVARMAAEGRSNPEIAQALFVSRKTVETHLRHVYAKLGVPSRSALTGVLAAKDQGASLTRSAEG